MGKMGGMITIAYTNFMNLGQIAHQVIVITPILPLFTTFVREEWLTII